MVSQDVLQPGEQNILSLEQDIVCTLAGARNILTVPPGYFVPWDTKYMCILMVNQDIFVPWGTKYLDSSTRIVCTLGDKIS